MVASPTLRRISVALERNPYEVVIGAGGLHRLGDELLAAGIQPGRRILVVSNPDVAGPYGEVCLQSLQQRGFNADLLVIDAGEDRKTQATVASIHDAFWTSLGAQLADAGPGWWGGRRHDRFAAATWLRGIRVIRSPPPFWRWLMPPLAAKRG